MNLEHFFSYFKPASYQITLDINQTKHTFTGEVIIEGEVTAPDGLVKLHANYLEIDSIKINNQNIDFTYQDNVLSFKNPDSLPIVIRYSGKITDQMNGIYPCYYTDNHGQKTEVIATQFESHYAREVFPCIDEPIAKATFSLTLLTDQAKTVLSNMPIAEQVEITDKTAARLKTVFEPTPIMSCYTFGFVVGDLVQKTDTTKSGVKVSAYATSAHKPEALTFALNVAVKAIEFYEDFLGVPYPLKKCDHIALPDFAAGAMENWGLVTYREALLLAYDNTSISSKKQIASVVAHELAHMWFGNLVTMKWWDELWLNESLATLLEHYAVDAIYPEYHIWYDFHSSNFQYAQSRDALPNVQPVLMPVNHPDEISTIFDGAIVYAKGACIMLMLQKYLGLETFKQALGAYLRQFAYGSPTTTDFLAHFDRLSGKNITEFMQNWLHQSGFPLIKLSNNQLVQQTFGYEKAQTWPIPLRLDLNNNHEPFLLTEPKLERRVDNLLINKDILSFAVVDYDQKHKADARQLLMTQTASELDRFYFLSNQLLLAKYDYIDPSELVTDLKTFIGQTPNLLIWTNLAKIVGSLRFFVEMTTAESQLKRLAADLAQPQAKLLGRDTRSNDTPDDLELRSLVIGQLSYAEDPDTLNFLITKFDQAYQHDEFEALASDLRLTVMSAKLKHDFEMPVFKKLLSLYQTTLNPELKSDLRAALTSVKQPAAGEILVQLLNDRSVIKPQDLAAWFVMILRNRYLKTLAWDWLKANFINLRQLFSENKDYADFVKYSGAVLFTDQDLTEYQELFVPYADDLAIKRDITVGINEITLRNRLFKTHAKSVANALEK